MYIDSNIFRALKVESSDRYRTDIMFQTIYNYMKHCDILKDSVEILDYANPYFHVTILDPERDYTLDAQVEMGGSEGIYLSFKVRQKDGTVVPVGTFKSLEEGFGGTILMGKIAGALAYLFDLYMYANF